jgi:hypothetical protein
MQVICVFAAAASVALARYRQQRRRKLLLCGSHDLTIIITTSAIRSNPSTAMIEDTVRAFSLVDGLQSCSKIIVCDGATVTQSKPHYKKGKITADDASRYHGFIAALKGLGETGALPNTYVLPLPKRAGFAQAVKAALTLVKTKFVMVVQHDQHIIRGVQST